MVVSARDLCGSRGASASGSMGRAEARVAARRQPPVTFAGRVLEGGARAGARGPAVAAAAYAPLLDADPDAELQAKLIHASRARLIKLITISVTYTFRKFITKMVRLTDGRKLFS